MDREASILREKLDAFLRDEAETRLAQARRDADAEPLAVVHQRHAWLAGRSARDLLSELRDRGRIDEDEARATARHLARFVRERELASVRATLRAFPERRLDVDGEGVPFAAIVAELYRGVAQERESALGRAVERGAQRAIAPIREARERGDEAAEVFERLARPRAEDDAKREVEARASLVDHARAFLAATRDLRDEALSFLAHAAGRTPTFTSLLASIRFASLDDAVARQTRSRRFSELVAPLEVGRELGARVRVEAATAGLSPRVTTLVLAPPTDVRLVTSNFELGVLSELAFFEAAGAALVRVLAHPALPPALARPTDTSFARTMGRLFALRRFDVRTLERERRVPDRVLDTLRRAAATIALLELRVAAASVARDANAGLDAAADALDTALGVRMPGSIALLFLHTPRSGPERLRAGIAALASSHALRELYDEDYLRNPRMAEHLRVAAGLAGGTTAESFCHAIEADRARAPRVLVDWFEGRA